MLQFAQYLSHISSLSVLIPVFFLLSKKQALKISTLKILGILLLASALSELMYYIPSKINKLNIFAVNVYTLAEVLLLSLMYGILLKNKKTGFAFFAVFIAFFIINTLYFQPFNQFQTWTLVFEAFIFILYSVGYYCKLFKTHTDLLRSSSFWLNTAVFIYFAFDLFLFVIANYIFTNMSEESKMISWSFHNFNNILKNILFAVAIGYAGVKREAAY